MNSCHSHNTVYDRIDATATSTQFGVATIRERRLFRSAWVRAEKKFSEKVNTSTRLVISTEAR